MPTWTFECPVHGEFELTAPIARHRDHPECPYSHCRETTVQTYHASRPKDWAIQPVVLHVDKKGNVRFPGHANGKIPRGFERVELKTLAEIQAFEHKMNHNLSCEAQQHQENEEKFFAPLRAKLRGELRQKMQSMSRTGRDFARYAMAVNDARERKKTDVGFHIQVLHFDASNREPFREGRGFKPTRWI